MTINVGVCDAWREFLASADVPRRHRTNGSGTASAMAKCRPVPAARNAGRVIACHNFGVSEAKQLSDRVRQAGRREHVPLSILYMIGATIVFRPRRGLRNGW
jgi:hypothetical protein